MALTLKKNILTAFAAAAVAFGASSAQAASSPTNFTVNPASIGAGQFSIAGGIPHVDGSTFVAQALTGNSSELLHANPTNTGFISDGYIKYGYFNSGANNISLLNGTLNADGTRSADYFQPVTLYVKFHIEDQTISATYNPDGSLATQNNVLTKLTFSMFVDTKNDTIFTQSGSAGLPGMTTGVEATVTNDLGDIFLGSGTLGAGLAELNYLGGATLNANTSFTLSPEGKAFFIAPVPFFSMSFNGFNNQTGGAIVNNDGTIAINAGGQTSFDNAVPEPTSIALLGLGLLGVGATARRRKAA